MLRSRRAKAMRTMIMKAVFLGNCTQYGRPYIPIGCYNYVDLVNYTDSIPMQRSPSHQSRPQGDVGYGIGVLVSASSSFTTSEYILLLNHS